MDDLIKALTILRKYGNPERPTHCEHDVLQISPNINPERVSNEDKAALDALGFIISSERGDEFFQSFRFGSA
jgi:hypothetical protein